jgi:predicted DNA-binding protein (MmcQ/YjbR family)
MTGAEAIRALCASQPAATWDYRYEFGMRAYRVGGKIFALVSDDGSVVSLKCDPGLAEVLRRNFDSIVPPHGLNKRHWNSVRLDGGVPAAQIADLVRHAYDLVLAGLQKKQQAAIRAESPWRA